MTEHNSSRSSLTRPPLLKPGDRVALIAPSGRPDSPGILSRCIRVVEEMGFRPHVGKSALKVWGSMAGTDEERAEDLQEAIADEAIRGILCLSGGWGSMRLLPLVELQGLKSFPKVVVGCDDNAALLLAVNTLAGMVTFYGPNLDQVESKFTFDRLRAALTQASVDPIGCQSPSELFPASYCAVEGCVEGTTSGGNLTAVTSLLGTRFLPSFDDTVLLLEDANEQYGILDRWITNLYLSGILQAAAGVGFGTFDNCSTKGSEHMLSIEDTFGDRLQLLRKPSCFGLQFGQGRETCVVPLGVRARLDCSACRLEFLEPALT